MYKAKKITWIFMIILSIVIYNFTPIKSAIVNFFKIEKYNVHVNTKEFTLTTKFDTFTHPSGVKINIVDDESSAEIIILDHSDREIEGYTKYEKQFHSPILMFVPKDIHTNKANGFISRTHGTSTSSYLYIQKDLKVLLEAIEKNKTYKDININSKYFNTEKIILAIPNKDAKYYSEIVELISLTLADYDVELAKTEKIKTRVDNIISKSVFYEDAAEYIEELCENSKSKKPIVLAPEYICIDNSSINTLNSSSYIACIPYKTLKIYYDLYTKNNDTEGYYDAFFNKITKKKFLEKVGLRNKERNFETYKVMRFRYNTNNIPSIN